ncbi:hypothetical protein KP509_24G056600 [Ceratopteris richardii]|nr:hypothetical protein KP509_24G056600 [Ceratopteris richardii]
MDTCLAHKVQGLRNDDTCDGAAFEKRVKLEASDDVILLSASAHKPNYVGGSPSVFQEPLSMEQGKANGISMSPSLQSSCVSGVIPKSSQVHKSHSRQFWKAGDYQVDSAEKSLPVGGIEHIRIHPKFLHSNATSHKWALGAIAELLDNALDEVSNGATFVKIDALNVDSVGDGKSPMLLFQDNGGGMNPDSLRHCMSFGYSVKSKKANTIGQYGNGFKTSTMRLGADVIVFSRTPAKEARVATCSIGLLSYTFLRDTDRQDIIVPMVDFEVQSNGLQKLLRSHINDWDKNMETIKRWSPFSTESELLEQLKFIGQQGTRIIVYNLWENDEGELELDFHMDSHDIQLRGVNKDAGKIMQSDHLPYSKHFLSYRYSLRSYASILYLRLPSLFKIILRGVEVRHHCLVNEMMIVEKHTYKPLKSTGEMLSDGKAIDESQHILDMKAVVTLGFVKDAKEHPNIQGFNVYHKNRLIKPFWQVWNSSGSHGRGIIGVLEANFVEPAHDKQGFERTSVLARLEARLLKMQKDYWFSHCHKVGYYNHYVNKNGRPSLIGPSIPKNKSNLHRQNGLVLKAFPRSSRSRTRRLPAKKFQKDACRLTHGESAQQLREMPRSISCTEVQDGGIIVAENTCKDLAIGDAQQQKAHPSNSRERYEFLKTEFRRLQQDLFGAQKQMEAALEERNTLKRELEDERSHGMESDTELRKKLKEAVMRVKKLEAENMRLKSSQ